MPRFSGCTVLGLAAALALAVSPLAAQVRVASPDGRNEVTVEIREGRLTYGMTRDRRPLVLPSGLGFRLRGAPALRDSLRITDSTRPSWPHSANSLPFGVSMTAENRLTMLESRMKQPI